MPKLWMGYWLFGVDENECGWPEGDGEFESRD